MGASLIRVAIVEDHPLSRQGLMQVIERSTEAEVVMTAASVGELEEVGGEGIDVVLLDLHLSDAEGADAVLRVTARVPATLVVSAADEHQGVIDAIGAGARGYLTKGADPGEIVRAVTAVASGGVHVSPMLAAHLLRHARSLPPTESGLTDEDRELLSLVAQGETEEFIAGQLSVSVAAIRARLGRVVEGWERDPSR